MNILDPIYQQALLQPNAVALSHQQHHLSYAQLCQLVERCACALHGHGIRHNDVVMVRMGGLYQFHLVLILALARLGAPQVPIGSELSEDKIKALALTLNAKWFVHQSEVSFSSISALTDETAMTRLVASSDWLTHAIALLPNYNCSNTVLRYELTSGTTGASKVIARTHKDSSQQISLNKAITPPSHPPRFMLYMSILVAISLREVLRVWFDGGTVVLPNDDLESFPEQVCELNIHQLLTSPFTIRRILQHAQSSQRPPNSTPLWPDVTYLLVGGGKLNPDTKQHICKLLTPHLYDRYGTTEMGALAMATPDVWRKWPDSSGFCLPWIEAEVVDEEDRPLPYGTTGILRFKGLTSTNAYVGDTQASECAFRQGWYYPGDKGRLELGRLLFLSDRDDGVLNIGGFKILAQEIETVLLSESGLSDAGAYVVWLPETQEQVVMAAVVCSYSVSEAYLKEKCRAQLGDVAAPVRIFQLPQLPRNGFGKLQRHELVRRTVSVGVSSNQPNEVEGK